MFLCDSRSVLRQASRDSASYFSLLSLMHKDQKEPFTAPVGGAEKVSLTLMKLKGSGPSLPLQSTGIPRQP